MHVNALLDRKILKKTLTMVFDRVVLEDSNVEYRLVGTGAALLHRVKLPAGDIDILVKERQGVKIFNYALSCFDCLMTPTYLEDMRQYYAEFRINKVEVGISSVEIETDEDWIETYGPRPWTHYVLLPCESHIVPTVKLELRLITELHRNRPERYTPIIEHMRINGYDQGLLRRGIKSLPEDLQNEVLSKLNSN
jgi:hypothetical protein